MKMSNKLCHICYHFNCIQDSSNNARKMILWKKGKGIIFEAICSLHASQIRDFTRNKEPKDILKISEKINAGNYELLNLYM